MVLHCLTMLEGTVRAWLSYLIDHMTYVSIYIPPLPLSQ